ncbi:hypothetical protein NP493_941g02021 [Ridgeia piscesae]|uniref:Uncharacterized protein n=1 Tax=Ridgeia piscesae TaxID=27915 RepID=A0AAD9KKY9_RIDPI|nr:hypothetical protein NP493_941g02021 [Ridgeia piscesae]
MTNGSVGGDDGGGDFKAGIRLQKMGDVKLEEMDVEKTGGHSEEQLHASGLSSLTKEVLKYSQVDVNRMLNEWKLALQAKDNEWLKKLEAKDEEKNLLRDMVNTLKQRDIAEYERKLMEVIGELS